MPQIYSYEKEFYGKKPREMEKVAEIVYRIVTTPGFLENAYPSLCIVMNESIDNEVWSARILTTIALFEAIKVLPFVVSFVKVIFHLPQEFQNK